MAATAESENCHLFGSAFRQFAKTLRVSHFQLLIDIQQCIDDNRANLVQLNEQIITAHHSSGLRGDDCPPVIG